MLPKIAIEEFKQLYEKRFGKKLDDAEATLRANNLVNLYKAIYQPKTFSDTNINTNFNLDNKLKDIYLNHVPRSYNNPR